MALRSTFEARAQRPNTHPLASYLYELCAAKRTNLCVSADVNSTTQLLKIAEEVGDYICVLKTHADIIGDFGDRTIRGLKEISRRKRFLIFEDRKFGDIGSRCSLRAGLGSQLNPPSDTVKDQYTKGPLRIADWAHLTNAHIFPGPAIISALQEAAASALQSSSRSVSTEVFVGTPSGSGTDDGSDEDAYDEAALPHSIPHPSPGTVLGRKASIVTTTHISQTIEPAAATAAGIRSPSGAGPAPEHVAAGLRDPPLARGLLLLAQMSSAGNLLTAAYTQQCVLAARRHPDFVLGFVAQRALNAEEADNFVCLTPGVSLPVDGQAGAAGGDGLGQQYRTPETVVLGDGCDIVIVGRGVIGATDRAAEAKRYRDEAWKAYSRRVRP